MRRVLVVGGPGSGKTTFSVRLGRLLDLPVHNLDAVFWKPGWVESSREEFAARQQPLVAGERWILDGNYGGTRQLRLAAADTVVFLDLPVWLCLVRVLRRWWRWRGRSRPDLPEGLPEKMDWTFLSYIVWTWPRSSRPSLRRDLGGWQGSLIRLRSSAEARRFLERLECQKTSPA